MRRIQALLMPNRSGWQPMLMGLAVAAAAAGAAAAFEPPKAVEAVLVLLALAAWCIGACAMVGYVRWFFGSELQRAAQERAEALEKEKGKTR